jgi:hypothetical protein
MKNRTNLIHVRGQLPLWRSRRCIKCESPVSFVGVRDGTDEYYCTKCAITWKITSEHRSRSEPPKLPKIEKAPELEDI